MKHVAHPIGERDAAVFHGLFVVGYILALAFHATCAWRHFQDHKRRD